MWSVWLTHVFVALILIIVCIMLQILFLSNILLVILSLYASLSMLAHWDILLIWVSASLSGWLLSKSQLSLSFNVDVHSVLLSLVTGISLFAFTFVPLHNDSFLVVTAALQDSLSTSIHHIFLSDVIVCPLKDISWFGFLQKFILHAHFWTVVYIYITVWILILPVQHPMHTNSSWRTCVLWLLQTVWQLL